jgi:hypothetical protein
LTVFEKKHFLDRQRLAGGTMPEASISGTLKKKAPAWRSRDLPAPGLSHRIAD